MKIAFFTIVFLVANFLIVNPLCGQFLDDFTDQDFTTNPSWTGNNTDFEINTSDQLHLNTPGAGSAYLSTSSPSIHEASWEFYLKMEFNPSSSNYCQVYLVSDQSDLSGDLTGYFVKIGGTEDEISLYYQTGQHAEKIIDGLDARISVSVVEVRVRVTRNDLGHWELFTDLLDGNNYISEGSTFDDRLKISSFFGLICHFTSTRKDKFYFDDFNVTGLPYQDQDPPELKNITVTAPDQLQLAFNEPLAYATANQLSNYKVIPDLGQPLDAIWIDSLPQRIDLYFPGQLVNGRNYQIIAKQLTDTSGNTLSADTLSFIYFSPVDPKTRSLVINEIMADPSPPRGLPEYEFLELFNPDQHPFNLKGWQLSDQTTTAWLDSLILLPGQYLLLIPAQADSAFSQKPNTMVLDPWPSLNNDQDSLLLKDPEGMVVDQLLYLNTWYQDQEKASGGWSLEQRKPHLPCSDGNNWTASTDPSGGTPGITNAIYSNLPDDESPAILDFTIIDPQSIYIGFNEMMDPASLIKEHFQLEQNLVNASISSPNAVELHLDMPLKQGKTGMLDISGLLDCSGNAMNDSTLILRLDTVPPQLLQVVPKGYRELLLYFDEHLDPVSALEKDNFQLLPGAKPFSCHLDTNHIIHVFFDQDLMKDQKYTFTCQNLADTVGNRSVVQQQTFKFLDQLDTLMVKDENTLCLVFDQSLDTAAAKPENFRISALGNPVGTEIVNTNSLNLYFNQNLESDNGYTLFVSNLWDAGGDPMVVPERVFYYDGDAPKLMACQILDHHQIRLKFNEPVAHQLSLKLYNFWLELFGAPDSCFLVSDSVIQINYSQRIQDERSYSLTITGIRDMQGNTMKRKKINVSLDLLGPYLVDLQVFSPHKIRLRFSELLDSAKAVSKSHYRLNQNHPASARLLPNDARVVELTFAAALLIQDDHVLSINGLQDIHQNFMQPDSIIFSNLHPEVAAIYPWSDHTLQLLFSRPVANVSHENISLSDSLRSESIKKQDDLTWQFDFPAKFKPQQVYELALGQLSDTVGYELPDTTLQFTYQPALKSIQFIDPGNIQLNFRSAPLRLTEKDFQIMPDLAHPFLLIRDNDDPLKMKLWFQQLLQEDQDYRLTIPGCFDLWENVLPATDLVFQYDQSPPLLDTLKMQDQDELILIFSEPLDQASAMDLLVYAVDQIHPDLIMFNPDLPDKVVLSFSPGVLSDQQEHQLKITGLADQYQNKLNQVLHQFVYQQPYKARWHDLLITEIMADPNPVQGLPAYEYVELFNSSAHNISIKDYFFGNEDMKVKLPAAVLSPGEYLVLTSKSAFQDYTSPIQVINLDSWPALRNSEDRIYIATPEQQMIHMIGYQSDWYKDHTKQDGGWSLEMIDVRNPCGEYHNWIASSDEKGGTPGKLNAVTRDNPDLTKPFIQKVLALDSLTIRADISEILAIGDIQQVGPSLDPQIPVRNFYWDSLPGKAFIFELDQALECQRPYKLQLKQMKDCVGNMSQDQQFTFYLPEPAQPGDLVINEILFEPVSGSVEFVELFNRSQKTIDLKGWKLMVGQQNPKDINLAKDHYVLEPSGFLVLTPEVLSLKGVYPAGKDSVFMEVGLPVLKNDEGFISLIAPQEVLIDSVHYYFDLHFELLQQSAGISLERLSPYAPTNDPNNWKSAATNVRATPGYLNSQAIPDQAVQGNLSVEPPAFAVSGMGREDHTLIHYSFDQPGNIANLTIYDQKGRLIKRLARNEHIGAEGFFRWDGINESGSKVGTGYYLIFLEVFDLAGNLTCIKDKVAVSGLP